MATFHIEAPVSLQGNEAFQTALRSMKAQGLHGFSNEGKAIDVFVMPLFAESFSNTLIAAMSAAGIDGITVALQ